MKLHTVKPNPYATKAKKRVGRGPGSGTGKTAGRGENGQNSRSGGGVRVASKVVKLLYLEDYLKEVSLMLNLRKYMQLLIYQI